MLPVVTVASTPHVPGCFTPLSRFGVPAHLETSAVTLRNTSNGDFLLQIPIAGNKWNRGISSHIARPFLVATTLQPTWLGHPRPPQIGTCVSQSLCTILYEATMIGCACCFFFLLRKRVGRCPGCRSAHQPERIAWKLACDRATATPKQLAAALLFIGGTLSYRFV